MNSFMQFGWAMWDSAQAALIGLNPVPALIISVFIGMAQGKRSNPFLNTLLALVPSVLIAAMWPMVSGYQPIWPDFTQLEVEIQTGVTAVMCFAIIVGLSLVKHTLSLVAQPKPNGHKPV